MADERGWNRARKLTRHPAAPTPVAPGLRRGGRRLLVVLLLIGVAGCGGRRLYPVRGKVVYKDETPLRGGLVVFEAVDPAAKVSASGPIQEKRGGTRTRYVRWREAVGDRTAQPLRRLGT